MDKGTPSRGQTQSDGSGDSKSRSSSKQGVKYSLKDGDVSESSLADLEHQQELPAYEELDEGIANLKRYNNKVDYIITHSCSERALAYPAIRNSATLKLSCPESGMLSYFEDIAEYKHWYFGHFHIDAELGGRYTALYQDIVRIE